ncbi:MAG: DUF814 domain-containing protein [Deltaproteobacteria bacterium]|nr:DUF814 domain-containing protein [Deltaproteobacteria bacterium]MBN2670338.1 DUF814 domain-containing protein [Deltaproteobacteria bacterium]
MSFSAKEIDVVAENLNREVSLTLVRKVLSPAAGNRICMELRGPGRNHYLQLCVAAQFCSLGRVNEKPKAADVPVSFVMLLRKHLINCVVRKIESLNRDRVVAIRLERKSEGLTLLAELSGRHGNLFLLDANNVIMGTFYPNRSNKRPLVVGEPYTLPLNPPERFNQSCRIPAGPNVDIEMMQLYVDKEQAHQLSQKRAQVNRAANALLKKQRTLVRNLQTDQQNAARAAQLQSHAYVIQANLQRIARGQEKFTGVDFEGREVSIPLNPKCSAVENMQSMFEKASRLNRASDKIEERLLQAMVDEEKLQTLHAQIATADNDALDAIAASLSATNAQVVERARGKTGPAARLPYKQFSIFSAHTARVGKNAKDNDALTLRHARPNDLWLHVRGIPGSHVVVPLGRGEEPSQDILIDAAHLAAHFSSARGDDHVEVTYTKRKYVQKPKGFAVGAVRLLKEKTFVLKFDPARLQTILSSNTRSAH